jgi:hypothetical protein
MGRRLKNAPVVSKVQLNVKVSEALKGKLEKKAIAENRDLTDVVVEALNICVEAISL